MNDIHSLLKGTATSLLKTAREPAANFLLEMLLTVIQQCEIEKRVSMDQTEQREVPKDEVLKEPEAQDWRHTSAPSVLQLSNQSEEPYYSLDEQTCDLLLSFLAN